MKTIRSIFEEKIERTNAQLAALAAEADALRRKIAEIDTKAHELKSQLNFIYAWQSEVGEGDAALPDDGPESESTQPDKVAPDVESETDDSHTLPVDALIDSHWVGRGNPDKRNGAYPHAVVAEIETPEPTAISAQRYLEPVSELPHSEPVLVGGSESGHAQPTTGDFADLRPSRLATVAVAELRHAEPTALDDAESRSPLPVLSMSVQDFAVVSSSGNEVPVTSTRATEVESSVRETVPPIPMDVFKRQSPAALNISDIARIIMRRAEREN